MDDGGYPDTESNPTESDPGKMFIGGLHSQTTEECLQRYFQQFGDVKECVVMRDTVTKRSRGFGFVRFVDQKSVEEVLASMPHIVDGKKIDPKRAIPKRPSPNQFKKVFVGGLPPDVTAPEIKEYFEAFGKVTEILLMHDRITKRLRGFGFITFESDAAGKHVCETGFHKIRGKNVECKKAQPKEVMLLQGKGRGFVVNLPAFQLTRSPMSFGLTAAMQFGRGRDYTSSFVPQGFLNMPERRTYTDFGTMHAAGNSATSQDAPSSSTNNLVNRESVPFDHNIYNSVQLTQYGTHETTVVTPASPLSQVFSPTTSQRVDVAPYLTASSRQEHLYHNGHTSSPQGPFGQGIPQVTLRQ